MIAVLEILFVSVFLFGPVLSLHSDVDYRSNVTINKVKYYNRYESFEAEMVNDLNEEVLVCWSPSLTQRAATFGLSDDDYCWAAPAGETVPVDTIPDDVFIVKRTNPNDKFHLSIVGGKHWYKLSEYANEPSFFSLPKSEWRNHVAIVASPSICYDGSGLNTISLFHDAARRAAYRHGLALCMCGEFNATTSFTREDPIEEMPVILNGSICGCDARPEDPSDSTNGLYGLAYDMYMPCQFSYQDAPVLLDVETCADEGVEGGRNFDQVRLFLLHTTNIVDMLTLKNKMWNAVIHIYGREDGSLIMPESFLLRKPIEFRLFKALCQRIQAAGRSRHNVFIMKDVMQHRQMGITLKTADEILAGKNKRGFSMATLFLPDPFLVKGYKINIRRYFLLACTGGRLRGYVHDDGKNIYSRLPYVHPWEGEYWEGKPKVLKRRLEELITSGYVPSEFFDDKPLSGLEFFDYVKALGDDNYNITLFERSMWARLSLVTHAAQMAGESLCSVDPEGLRSPGPPSCLHEAVRFQHLGCDFHVDSTLTGATSRIFECNKGPDMSVHSPRDGIMKRNVAADIISFMGFKGEWDGSAENARKNNLELIYDSDLYDPEEDLTYLRDLNEWAQHFTDFYEENDFQDLEEEADEEDVTTTDEL